MITEWLAYFDELETLNSMKLSANKQNTKYTLGTSESATIKSGTPDIGWNTVVFVSNPQCIYTHGTLYKANDECVAEYDSPLHYDISSSQITASSDEVKGVCGMVLSGANPVIQCYLDGKNIKIHTHVINRATESKLMMKYGGKKVVFTLNLFTGVITQEVSNITL